MRTPHTSRTCRAARGAAQASQKLAHHRTHGIHQARQPAAAAGTAATGTAASAAREHLQGWGRQVIGRSAHCQLPGCFIHIHPHDDSGGRHTTSSAQPSPARLPAPPCAAWLATVPSPSAKGYSSSPAACPSARRRRCRRRRRAPPARRPRRRRQCWHQPRRHCCQGRGRPGLHPAGPTDLGRLRHRHGWRQRWRWHCALQLVHLHPRRQRQALLPACAGCRRWAVRAGPPPGQTPAPGRGRCRCEPRLADLRPAPPAAAAAAPAAPAAVAAAAVELLQTQMVRWPPPQATRPVLLLAPARLLLEPAPLAWRACGAGGSPCPGQKALACPRQHCCCCRRHCQKALRHCLPVKQPQQQVPAQVPQVLQQAQAPWGLQQAQPRAQPCAPQALWAQARQRGLLGRRVALQPRRAGPARHPRPGSHPGAPGTAAGRRAAWGHAVDELQAASARLAAGAPAAGSRRSPPAKDCTAWQGRPQGALPGAAGQATGALTAKASTAGSWRSAPRRARSTRCTSPAGAGMHSGGGGAELVSLRG